MLRILLPQVHGFGAAQIEDFERRMVIHVRSMFARQYGDAPEPVVRDVVVRLHRQAVEHEFVTERQIMRYIDLAIYFGPGFGRLDGDGWWIETLSAAGMLADEKLDALEQRGLGEPKG